MQSLPSQFQREFILFQRQYLQVQLSIKYPAPECLRHEGFQKALYDGVFSDGAVEHHPPEKYQFKILKELMKRIESSITDWDEQGISDDLMSRLSVLFSSSLPSEAVAAQRRSYVTYTLSLLSNDSPSPPTITLLEARHLLAAAGVTGHRTWEAGLHLGSYLSSPNCSIPIANKSILELGAGTGYLSILCAKYLGASHVTATDGADIVVSDMATNFYLNGLQDASQINAMELKWGYPLIGGEQREWNSGRKIDVVLGADVTYDGTNNPALVATLGELEEMYPGVMIVIAAIVRNENTFERLLKILEGNGFELREIDFPVQKPEEQEGPFYLGGAPIRICCITRKTKDAT